MLSTSKGSLVWTGSREDDFRQFLIYFYSYTVACTAVCCIDWVNLHAPSCLYNQQLFMIDKPVLPIIDYRECIVIIILMFKLTEANTLSWPLVAVCWCCRYNRQDFGQKANCPTFCCGWHAFLKGELKKKYENASCGLDNGSCLAGHWKRLSSDSFCFISSKGGIGYLASQFWYRSNFTTQTKLGFEA